MDNQENTLFHVFHYTSSSTNCKQMSRHLLSSLSPFSLTRLICRHFSAVSCQVYCSRSPKTRSSNTCKADKIHSKRQKNSGNILLSESQPTFFQHQLPNTDSSSFFFEKQQKRREMLPENSDLCLSKCVVSRCRLSESSFISG
jgi:hypothetical protein